ncbi:MAG: carboxypeptidase-like regulatory domain-containing protein [Janthinobacterium lividum]
MRNLLLTLLGSLLLTLPAAAQSRITGVVQDSVTHEALPFASVFLANTTLGATTDDEGKFTFERVPKGAYDIVASYVGYRLSKQNITVGTAPQTVTLRPASSGPQLAEVTVKANPHQADDYRKFVGLFLGQTAFSKKTRITNPGEVDVFYNDSTKQLTASADDFVQVENEALGYRIKYFGMRFRYDEDDESENFSGQPVFEEMTPRDAQQQQQWDANRAAAYHGSLTHFLKSVYDNQVEQEGFLAQQVRIRNNPQAVPPVQARLYPAPLRTDSLRRVSADKSQVFLRFRHELQVAYFGETPDPNYDQPMAELGPAKKPWPTKREVSRLHLLVPEVEIQPNGTLTNPLQVLTGEYWGFEKIGELLPLDYVPK